MSLGCLFFFIPSLPEVIDSVHLKEGIAISDPTLNDKASGIYNAFYFLGAILAPILGGLMNDQVGYRETNDIMLLVAVLFSVAYLMFFGLSR